MAHENPYAPPRAKVVDVVFTAESQPVKLWSAQGRMGRVRFVAYNTAGYLVAWLLMAVAFAFVAWAPVVAMIVFLTPILLAFFVFVVLQWIKRCHDLGWSGWLWLLNFVPLVNVIFFLVLVFAPGNKGANAYGAPPPRNLVVHWVLACSSVVIMLLGILAAIAIPAYQDYLERARAAQVQ